MASSELDGKVALVTGASSGMGRATSLALAQQGAKIVCCDLNPKANPSGYESDLHISTADVITGRGGKAFFHKVDISVSKELEDAFAKAVSEYGRIDIVVNCAGYWAPFRLFSEEDDALWNKMVSINTLGTATSNRLAIRQFLRQDVDTSWGSRGRIINVSSCAGVFAFPGEVAYSATKASINHMTRAGALDHAKDWININCIAPGTVATGMARKNIEDEEILKMMKKATPWPRLGTSEDIAGTVMFLCSKASSWITGQVYSVDGGMTLGVPP